MPPIAVAARIVAVDVFLCLSVDKLRTQYAIFSEKNKDFRAAVFHDDLLEVLCELIIWWPGMTFNRTTV